MRQKLASEFFMDWNRVLHHGCMIAVYLLDSSTIFLVLLHLPILTTIVTLQDQNSCLRIIRGLEEKALLWNPFTPFAPTSLNQLTLLSSLLDPFDTYALNLSFLDLFRAFIWNRTSLDLCVYMCGTLPNNYNDI